MAEKSLRETLINELVEAGIPSPRLEADIILKHAAPSYPETTPDEEKKAEEMLRRRLCREPLDKIIGCREFYKSYFKVNQNVLTPRPDTEILVEKALPLLPEETSLQLLDLGVGSGCILLSLLAERKMACGTGVDISAAAADIAAENARALGLESRCCFIVNDWNKTDFPPESFDMIVSNPPYIPRAEIALLDREVREYDPLIALDGGEDGFACYRQLAAFVPLILKPGGCILLESGAGQAEQIAGIFTATGLALVEIAKDLAGINRCVILKKEVAK